MSEKKFKVRVFVTGYTDVIVYAETADEALEEAKYEVERKSF